VFGFNKVLCEVEVKRMCLSQANADLAEAAEKLEVIRKKLTVSLSLSLPQYPISISQKCTV